VPSPTFGARGVVVDTVAFAVREAWSCADRKQRPQVVNLALRRILGDQLADQVLLSALTLLEIQSEPPDHDIEAPAAVLELCVRCRKVKLIEERKPYRGKVRMEFLRDRQWMTRQFERLGRTDDDVALELGCCKISVRHWRNKFDIDPGKYHKPWMHEATMKRLIVDKRLAPGEIAEQLGIEVHSVRNWASRLGIANGKNGVWAYHGRQWWLERVAAGWTQYRMAEAAGIVKHAVLFHLRKWDLHTDRTPYERARLRKPKYVQLYEPNWLADQLKRHGPAFTLIASKVGCSPTTVKAAAQKLGLLNGRRDLPTPWTKDPEWYLERFTRRQTALEMAVEVGIKEKSIMNYMGELDLLDEYHQVVEVQITPQHEQAAEVLHG